MHSTNDNGNDERESQMIIRIEKENKEEMIAKLKDYFYRERSEEIGDLAAGNLYDFVMKEMGPYLYNQGVKDAKFVAEQKIMNLEEDLSSLEIPIR